MSDLAISALGCGTVALNVLTLALWVRSGGITAASAVAMMAFAAALTVVVAAVWL